MVKMEIKRIRINVKRFFTEEFKKARVREYEKGEFSVLEISKLYSINPVIIYRWIYEYSVYNKKSVKVVEMKNSGSKKIKDMELRIKELERAVGQKQIKLDYLEKMIDLAKDEYGIDIKKNSDTPQSSGTGKIDKK